MTPPSGPGERFTIELPADPAFVATARMFASTLARQAGVNEELLDDLKLAISEACSRALGSAGDGRLHLQALLHDGRLVFEVRQGELRTGEDTPATDDLAAGLSLELITVLFDDAEIVRGEDGTAAVRFSVPVA